VQQLLEENHLRWDSLGEILALGVSLEDLAQKTGNDSIQVLADALDAANSQYLDNNRSPSRNTGELDNRGSHFYLALYWARALAAQDRDRELQARFAAVAEALAENEQTIIDELNSVQGASVDIGGYYRPDKQLASQVMRPSETFNRIIDSLPA